MKTLIFIETILLLVMTSCGSDNTSTDGFITVDVTKSSYSPKKELVLQDFMDVEYIPLETNDEFINQGFVQDVGEKYILVKNRKNAGDVFVYASKSETQGMIITEAMYMGLPIVAVKATGIESLAEDSVNGILVSEEKGRFVKAVEKLK